MEQIPANKLPLAYLRSIYVSTQCNSYEAWRGLATFCKALNIEALPYNSVVAMLLKFEQDIALKEERNRNTQRTVSQCLFDMTLVALELAVAENDMYEIDTAIKALNKYKSSQVSDISHRRYNVLLMEANKVLQY